MLVALLFACTPEEPASVDPSDTDVPMDFGPLEQVSYALPCRSSGLIFSEPGDAGHLWVQRLGPAPARARVEGIHAMVTDSTFYGNLGCETDRNAELVWQNLPHDTPTPGDDFAPESVRVRPVAIETTEDHGDPLADALYEVAHTFETPVEVEAGDVFWVGIRVRESGSLGLYSGSCMATCSRNATNGGAFSGNPEAPFAWNDMTDSTLMVGLKGRWLEEPPE